MSFYISDENGRLIKIAGNERRSYLPLGTIICSAIIQNDAGLHLLDGSTLPCDGIYADFCTWLKANIDNVPTCTEEEFVLEVSTYGQCGKFVITDDYVVLPKITKFIEGLSNIGDIGTSLEAGLPNIEGSFDGRPHTSGSEQYGGALTNARGVFTYARHGSTTSNNGVAESGTSSKDDRVSFDASLSSEVYGKSSTVQPQATKYPYYIVVASIIKTDVTVNIDNIISDLNLLNTKVINLLDKPHFNGSFIKNKTYTFGKTLSATVTFGSPYVVEGDGILIDGELSSIDLVTKGGKILVSGSAYVSFTNLYNGTLAVKVDNTLYPLFSTATAAVHCYSFSTIIDIPSGTHNFSFIVFGNNPSNNMTMTFPQYHCTTFSICEI